MKTHTIKTPTAELLIIELPEGTISYQYSSNLETISAEVPNDKGVSFEQSRIEKGYTLLGKPDEIREEDAKLLVQCINVGTTNKYIASVEFFNNVNNRYYETAKESLLSLIESEIYWVNPFEKPEYDEDYQEEWYEGQYKSLLFEWHQAEQKTFARNRTLIFKKNN